MCITVIDFFFFLIGSLMFSRPLFRWEDLRPLWRLTSPFFSFGLRRTCFSKKTLLL